MLKISIITIHNINNFGSVFQAYALSTYLRNKGYDAEIIDYTPKYFRRKKLRTLVGQSLYLKSYMKRKKKYKQFISDNMNLSINQYYSFEQLKQVKPKADIYIAGGDQLWNSYHDSGRDPAYKLLFTDAYKISYGTSMGRSNFDRKELENLKDQIGCFKAISVRESSSVTLLTSVGIKNVVQVVDPVLLLQDEDYDKFLRKTPIEKYIFIYLVNKSELLDKTVQYISEALNLKVVLFAGLEKKCKCDYFLKDLGPDEVLSYIKNAEFVLSASFHATLFSIMFHKQFATLLPDTNTNERIEDLLGWTTLENRIIRDENNLSLALFKKTSFDRTDREIEKRRVESYTYLESELQRKR